MKFIYSLPHHFITCIVLVNLCLHGCTAHNTPTEEDNRQLTQAIFPLAYNKAMNYTKFLSQEGHLVTFYQEGTQLKAEVEEKPHHGFSQLHHLPVSIEQGKNIDQVMDATVDQPNPLIHVYPSFVYVGNVALISVSNTDRVKGKQKATDDEWQEKPNDTTQAATVSRQRVSENNCRTSLHMAALNGNLATVISLLLQGFHVNAKDQFGYTPLHLATYKGHTEIVRFLLGQGADVYTAERNGFCALHVASSHGHLPIVNLLLQSTDVNIKNKDGLTPLFLAIRSESMQTVAVLINSGADVNIKNKLGNTPLYEAVKRGNLDIVKLLCSKGANINVQNIYGWTPLHLAVVGLPDIVRYLATNGADTNIRNDEGLTPLQLAIQDRQMAG
jgi:ankyrin repeat protein